MAGAWQQLSDHLEQNQRGEEAIQARMMALNLFRELAGREQMSEVEAPDE